MFSYLATPSKGVILVAETCNLEVEETFTILSLK